MTLLNPWLLLGLLGVIGPIAAHLLNRARPRPVKWAAMRLLRHATVVRARDVRLEDLFMLLLRCLAMVLLVLAMSRPTLRRPASASSSAGALSVGAVIAIDGSMSMDHRDGLASRFERAKDRVRQIAKTLAPGAPLSVVLMADQPRILVRNGAYQAQTLDQMLETIKPLPVRMDLDANLGTVSKLLRELRAVTRECYLVTDAQATTWSAPSDQSRQDLAAMARDDRVYLVAVGSQNQDNQAITDFRMASGLPYVGGLTRYVAQVSSFGDRVQENLTVTLLADGKPADQRAIDFLAPGTSTAVSLYVRHSRVGPVQLTASLGSDALPADNQRYLVTEVRERVQVMCVDGEPSPEPFGSETDYLVRALEPRPSEPSAQGLTVRIVDWSRMAQQRLSDADVVVLANLPDLDPAQVAPLRSFVERGGGLIVFVGDRVQAALMNLRLQGEGRSLLPAVLGEVRGDASNHQQARSVRIESPLHPLASVLASLPADMMDQAHVYRYMDLQPTADARTILALIPGGEPLLVEHAVGLGRVLLVATTADRAWSDLVVHPMYPLLLQQAMACLTRRPQEQPIAIGAPVWLALEPNFAAARVTMRDPAGQQLAVPVTVREGAPWLAIPGTGVTQPGFYAVAAAKDRPTILAANVDARESDVKSVDDDGLAALCRATGMKLARGDDALGQSIQGRRAGIELWRPLLVAALVVFLIESLLARLFVARMVKGQGIAIRRGRGRAALPGKALTRRGGRAA